MPDFDASDPRHRICCCHVTRAAIIIGILELLGTLSAIASVKLLFSDDNSGVTIAIKIIIAIQLIVWILIAAAVCLMFFAIYKQISKLVIPNFILQILALFVIFCWIILYIVAFAGNRDLRRFTGNMFGYHVDSGITIVLVVFIVTTILNCIYQCWCIYVIYRCYNFLKEQEGFDRGGPKAYGGPKGYGGLMVYDDRVERPIYLPIEEPSGEYASSFPERQNVTYARDGERKPKLFYNACAT